MQEFAREIQQLKTEAKTLAHQLCHLPMNPYCPICNKAKMRKPPSRKAGGSRQVHVEKFGGHITAEFLVTRSYQEQGIDGDRIALVVKDIATDFIAVYPTARREHRRVCSSSATLRRASGQSRHVLVTTPLSW